MLWRFTLLVALLSWLNTGVAKQNEFLIGVGISLNDRSSANKYAQKLGVNSARIDVPWRQVELVKGQYQIPKRISDRINGLLSEGVKPLLIFGYGNPLYGGDKPLTKEAQEAFTAYAVYVASQYGTKAIYQVWNEWETSIGGTSRGRPEHLVRLEDLVCGAILRSTPGAVVLGGAVSSDGIQSGWISSYIKMGGAGNCSGIALNPYSYYRPGRATPERAIDLVAQIVESVKKHQSRSVDVYITEYGYPSYDGELSADLDEVRALSLRFLLLASAQLNIKGVWWYGLFDQGDNPHNKEHRFGIFNRNGTEKPVASSIREFTSFISSEPLRPTLRRGDDYVQVIGGVYAYRWPVVRGFKSASYIHDGLFDKVLPEKIKR